MKTKRKKSFLNNTKLGYKVQKKLSLWVFLLLFMIQGNSQSLTPTVICSGGKEISQLNAHLSYTIGEFTVQTRSQGNTLLTEGYQQPEMNITSLLDEDRNATSLIVYPIPASIQLWLGFRSANSGTIEYRILNDEGKVVFQSSIQNYINGNLINPLNLEHLPVGSYHCILNFTYNNKQEVLSKSFLKI